MDRDCDDSGLHNADVAIVVLDEHARIRCMNPTACAITACDEQDALDKDWFATFVPGPTGSELRDQFMQLMASPTDDDAYVQYDFVDTNGHAHPMVWHRRVIRDDDGRSVGTRSVGIDLTEQKRAEDALRENDERSQSLLRLYRLLGRANSYTAIVAAVMTELPSMTGYSGAGLAVLNDEMTEFRMLQSEGTIAEAADGIMELGEQFRAEGEGEQFLVLPVGDDPFLQDLVAGTDIDVIVDARTDPRTNKDLVATCENRTILNVPLVLSGRKLGLLNMGTFGDEEGVLPPSEAVLDYLRALSNHVAVAMDRVQFLAAQKEAAAALERVAEDAEAALDGIVQALASTTGERDLYTAMHQEQVARLSCAIAREMGLPDDTIDGIRIAGLLHDIGKIAVPTGILTRPGVLTAMEFGMVRVHSEVGGRLLANVPFHTPVAKVVRQHHERLDGSGYPDGLRGDEILLEARILAVADVVEAMTSHRPFRPALSVEDAIDEIVQGSGTKFDAEVVDACVKVVAAGALDASKATDDGEVAVAAPHWFADSAETTPANRRPIR